MNVVLFYMAYPCPYWKAETHAQRVLTLQCTIWMDEQPRGATVQASDGSPLGAWTLIRVTCHDLLSWPDRNRIGSTWLDPPRVTYVNRAAESHIYPIRIRKYQSLLLWDAQGQYSQAFSASNLTQSQFILAFSGSNLTQSQFIRSN
jgi:hypothetical protein